MNETRMWFAENERGAFDFGQGNNTIGEVEDRALALLLTAAPELLDALRAFFTEWDATNHDSAFAGYDVVRNHEDALRAAIAKAEGHL